jgi:hypothetical protein
VLSGTTVKVAFGLRTRGNVSVQRINPSIDGSRLLLLDHHQSILLMRADPVVCAELYAHLRVGMRCHADLSTSPAPSALTYLVAAWRPIKLAHLSGVSVSNSLTFEKFPQSKSLTENRIPMI